MQGNNAHHQRTEEEIARRRTGWNCLWGVLFLVGLLIFFYFLLTFSFGHLSGIGMTIFYVVGLGILLLLATPLGMGIWKSFTEDQ